MAALNWEKATRRDQRKRGLRGPTPKQCDYLKTLSKKACLKYQRPKDSHAASEEIDHLKGLLRPSRRPKPVVRISHGHTITQIGPNHFEGRPLEVQGR